MILHFIFLIFLISSDSAVAKSDTLKAARVRCGTKKWKNMIKSGEVTFEGMAKHAKNIFQRMDGCTLADRMKAEESFCIEVCSHGGDAMCVPGCAEVCGPFVTNKGAMAPDRKGKNRSKFAGVASCVLQQDSSYKKSVEKVHGRNSKRVSLSKADEKVLKKVESANDKGVEKEIEGIVQYCKAYWNAEKVCEGLSEENENACLESVHKMMEGYIAGFSRRFDAKHNGSFEMHERMDGELRSLCAEMKQTMANSSQQKSWAYILAGDYENAEEAQDDYIMGF